MNDYRAPLLVSAVQAAIGKNVNTDFKFKSMASSSKPFLGLMPKGYMRELM